MERGWRTVEPWNVVYTPTWAIEELYTEAYDSAIVA